MDRGKRIQRTDRIVERRCKIIQGWTTVGIPENNTVNKYGVLKKYNLKCSCSLCKKERYNRAKQKRLEKRDNDD